MLDVPEWKHYNKAIVPVWERTKGVVVMSQVQNRLMDFRQKKGKSKIQVAREVGVSRVTYYRYEDGERIPDAHTAILIANALDTTVEALWGSIPTAQ